MHTARAAGCLRCSAGVSALYDRLRHQGVVYSILVKVAQMVHRLIYVLIAGQLSIKGDKAAPAASSTAAHGCEPIVLPDVPPAAWRAVARTALAAEGDDISAWRRLSHVAHAWRESLKGAHC